MACAISEVVVRAGSNATVALPAGTLTWTDATPSMRFTAVRTVTEHEAQVMFWMVNVADAVAALSSSTDGEWLLHPVRLIGITLILARRSAVNVSRRA